MREQRKKKMTENQKKVIELSKAYERAKSELDLARRDLDSVLNQMELNTYFQDEATKTVYKIVKPKGTFVSFKDVDYHRTALEGERQGSLSKKEAQEAGYEV